MAQYQTILEFLQAPFGQKSAKDKLVKYDALYTSNNSKIVLNAYTKIDESYYFHVKVPSESQKDGKVHYDVVIRFFTDNPVAKSSPHIRDYYIQFFSNSPGFIYNYAVLYKNNGYLIDELYTKMDPRYFDKLPTKTNANLELSFDKSIYFACRFLNEKKFKVLNKFGIAFGKKLQPKDFFKEIKDFQSVQFENELLTIERQSLRGLSKNLKNAVPDRLNDTKRKVAAYSTAKEPRKIAITKKSSVRSTSTSRSIIRKTAGKSTTKK